MSLLVCHECSHGAVKKGQSYCSREAVYSRLTQCMQQKVLASFLEHQSMNELPAKEANSR